MEYPLIGYKRLMLAPSIATPQNQYFPANAERMAVHCLQSGYIGTHQRPKNPVSVANRKFFARPEICARKKPLSGKF